MPNYFSGTNSRAAGLVCAYEPYRIEWALLTINGTVVDTYEYDPENAVPLDVPLSAMFDSTHFPHGSTVTVELFAMDDGMNPYYDVGTATVINRLVDYGRYDLEVEQWNWNDKITPNAYTSGTADWASMAVPAEYLTGFGTSGSGINYELTTYEHSLRWTAQQCVDDTFPATVFYVASHGTPSGFWSDENDYAYDRFLNPSGPPTLAPTYVTGTTFGTGPTMIPVLPTRQLANGSNSQYLPPYNSGEPPVNLAFILSCCSGGVSNEMAEGFLYPYGNVYAGVSSFPENQAAVGFVDSVKLRLLTDIADVFFSALAIDGDTVNLARDDVNYFLSMQPRGDQSTMIIWGDKAAKLKGVYTGSMYETGTTPWFRS